MFGGSKSKIPAIITFLDGTKLHAEIPPGATPGLMSAISNENIFLEAWADGKRKFYMRQHMLCIEADEAAQAAKDSQQQVSAA